MGTARKFVPSSETVTDGHRTLGRINLKAEGCETFGPNNEYVAKFPNVAAARRALYELGKDSQTALGGAQ